MHQTALLTFAAHRRGTRPARRETARLTAVPPARVRPSGARLALRVAAALAGSLILIIALVDPLRSSDQFDPHTAAIEQGVRHG